MIIRHFRWYVAGLIFLATVINYIDRQALAVVAPAIRKDLHMSNTDFGNVATLFLLGYTISQLLSGKIVDRIGTRLGFSFFITFWSVAAMLHAWARSTFSLGGFRLLLGLGEAGNWPAAAKAIAEWFPARERAFAMSIFNGGAVLGAVFAPPLVVAITLRHGWQTAFLITGTLGFLWLLVWLFVYRPAQNHPWLSAQERELIAAGRAEIVDSDQSAGWSELFRCRQVWGLILCRFLTDPIWWLYIVWLPGYLHDARGFSLKEIGYFAWVPFLFADIGNMLGGGISSYLIKRGWNVSAARKVVMYPSAALMSAGIAATKVESPVAAIALICVVTFAFQSWIINVITLPSDLFPSRWVGSVAGIGGFGAGIGAMLFTLATGPVVDRFSYAPIFIAAGIMGPLGAVALASLVGKIEPVPQKILPLGATGWRA
ncbi:MAG TPA: MFS transporter [Acidobacteriota bacterium]|jgi:ACS family hexuronate transporter-like MFS transporter